MLEYDINVRMTKDNSTPVNIIIYDQWPKYATIYNINYSVIITQEVITIDDVTVYLVPLPNLLLSATAQFPSIQLQSVMS